MAMELFVLTCATTMASIIDPEWTVPMAMDTPPNNGRNCYGCIGWCTYGDMCTPPANIKWHDVASELGISGQGWPTSEMASPFNRFPAKAKAIVDNKVWATSQRSAGLKVRFATTAADVWIYWKNAESPIGDWLWNFDAHSGVDMYIEDEGLPGARLRWATSSGNAPMMSKALRANASAGFYSGLFNIPPRDDRAPRNFTVYFPLATHPNQVLIGAMSPHSVANVPVFKVPAPPKRVLFYGTSIYNGAAANRAGMGQPQQAERMLGWEGINIGFGGLGRMQPYYATSGLLSEIDYDIAVVDCEYNMHNIPPEQVFNLTVNFVGSLLERKPDVPVLVVEGHPMGNAWVVESGRKAQNYTREAYRRAYNHLLQSGTKKLFYARGEHKFGGRDINTDFEAQSSTVNGVHPPPLGLRSMAVYVTDIIRAIANGSAVQGVPMPVGPWPPTNLAPPPPLPSSSSVSASPTASLPPSVSPSPPSASPPSPSPPSSPPMRWVDARTLGVEGKGFARESGDRSFWQRFPSSAQPLVPRNIWRLSTQPSGMLVRFRTNASSVVINVTRLDFSPNTDDIFPTNGKYGIDVHIQDPSEKNFGKWRWAATEASTSTSATGSIYLPLDGVNTPPPSNLHNITVYLPIYSACGNLTIGVTPPNAAILPLTPHTYTPNERPLYVWGSSIAQGGVVTNAGMTWPSNLQRILGVPLLNFGFSGSCGMQPSVAAQLAKAQPPPRAFLMDCLPNLQQDFAPQVANLTTAVIKQLRTLLGPHVPIIILEGHLYTNNWIKTSQASQQLSLASAQHNAVNALIQSGDTNLYYVEGEGKLGDDPVVVQESTGGIGVHPSSLAHLHMAQFVADKIRDILF